jgi:hypothetical protein
MTNIAHRPKMQSLSAPADGVAATAEKTLMNTDYFPRKSI